LALGLLLASKQYMIFALPAVLLLVPRPWWWRRSVVLVGGALLTAVVVSAPLVLWDVHAFVHSAGTVQKLAPFREDALSYLVWIYHQWGRQPGIWLAFVAMLVGTVIALWRCPRDAAGFAGALALIYLPFIAFNKQAFANYYLFVIGALCCAVAALPLDEGRCDAIPETTPV
jgi:4-amino-4-deoxy-L-arabinose transferase-like glycosyltransferase